MTTATGNNGRTHLMVLWVVCSKRDARPSRYVTECGWPVSVSVRATVGLRERDEVGRGRYLDGNRQVNSCDFQRLDLDSVLMVVAQDLRSPVSRQQGYFVWGLVGMEAMWSNIPEYGSSNVAEMGTH